MNSKEEIETATYMKQSLDKRKIIEPQEQSMAMDYESISITDTIHYLEQENKQLEKQIDLVIDWFHEEAKKVKQLEEQLTDKDKEIEKLRTTLEQSIGIKNIMICEHSKDIQKTRKQVCEEIFKELQENVDCYFEERACNSPHSQLPYIWFNEVRFRKFLDKIEQAKENLSEESNID